MSTATPPPGALPSESLRAFLAYLVPEHLDTLAIANLSILRQLDAPILSLLADIPEERLVTLTSNGLEIFLNDLAAGRALATTMEGLRKWEAGELEGGISQDAIKAADLVLINAAQEQAILALLEDFTNSTTVTLAIVRELRAYYVRCQDEALKVFVRLRDGATQRAVRLEVDREAAVAASLEMHALNQNLSALAEELQARNEKIKSQNEELVWLSIKSEAANKMKSEFLANMSHELRTPLNSIIGYTELAVMNKKLALDERTSNNLNVVLRNSKHLLSLINDILDLSKVEAGGATIFAETVDPRQVLTSVVGVAEPLARQKGIYLKVEVPPEIGTIVTDETKVRQIVLNLVSNAVKFTRDGGVTIRAYPKGADRLVIEVADTGIGIAPEHQGMAFEEFRQVDASATREVGGTGLGLPIARKLARFLGGELTLSASEPDRGSTFVLDLPQATAGYRPPTAPAPVPAVPMRVQAPAHPGSKRTVIAIDDDPEALHLIVQMLADTGYTVVPATSGESGIELAKELHPYAITLDVLMPHLDGWTVLGDLKSDPDTSEIPVVILSMIENKIIGFSLGASDYLVKPVQRDDLLKSLEHVGAALQDSRDYVLVVEDDPDARELYRQILEKEGVRSIAVADGKEAVAAIEANPPALVILDLMMPHMDGFEVMAWLRSRNKTETIPVIVVTAKELTPDDNKLLLEAKRVICKGEPAYELIVNDLRTLLDGCHQEEYSTCQ